MATDNDPIRPEELTNLFVPLAADLARPCALAVSGGSDSTALMVLLADWLHQQGSGQGQHTVVTIDHGLRPQSAGEAREVAAQAAALGFRHVTLDWKGPKPATGIQAAARLARYRLIGDFMRVNAIGLLLTAHTQDDVAETMLMRLARGSGLDGLAAMAPRLRFTDLGFAGLPAERDPEVARPLLDVPKSRLRATLQARQISWIEDPSNQSPAFERARLRAARSQLDALGLTSSMLALSAGRLLRARRALERSVDQLCRPDAGFIGVDPCGCFAVELTRLRAADAEIALRVLGRLVAAAGGNDEPVPLGKLEAIAEALRSGDAGIGTWTLARALVAAKDGTLTVEREPGREPLPRLHLAPGEEARWDGRFRVWVGRDFAADAVEVRQLGETGLAELRQCGVAPTRAAARAAGLAPAFWNGSTLLAAPSLGYWTTPENREALGTQFIWMDATRENL